MNVEQIGGIVRAIGAFLGGYLVSRGWFTAETLNWIIGSGITLGVTLWSLWSNKPGKVTSPPIVLPTVVIK